MKNIIVIIGAVCVLAFLIIWAFASQNGADAESEQPSQGSEASADDGIQGVDLPPSTLEANEDGVIEVVIPQNLFGGEDKTAEQYLEDYYNNFEDFDQQRSISIVANDDGTVSEFFTPEQLEQLRQNIYTYAQLHISYNFESIQEVIFEDDMLFGITVMVNSELYHQSVFESYMVRTALAAYAGMYQILTGVPPDEWHTTITIKDGDTGELLSHIDFPNDDMYRVY